MLIKNLSNKDIHWFNIAMKISELSECKFRHGAVLLSKGRPLGFGINSLKTRNINKFLTKDSVKNRPEYCFEAEKRRARQETNHAEFCSILKARKRLSFNATEFSSLKGTCIYSARSLKNGKPGNSFPCASCLQIIMMEKIKTLVYFENTDLKKIEL